ncbi:hypothetical protein OCOJLMKI_1983 [Methylobacterium iners]|uniref:MFS transporter n=1 Tax=Methylobacterium iners TaxID=418707 RepID=A0ABQ4RVM6_9HYPH|nr:hypothetical protein OCOJLMKI_1983 [Methylobacterium iners]
MPTITAIVVFQVLRRAGNFAIAKPIREVLFTVVPRENRYKAKNFIDTVVYLTGGQLGAWTFTGIAALGLGSTAVAVTAVPPSIAWLLISLWLGSRLEKRDDRARGGADAV